jgi:hypothetical protein
MVDNVIAIIRYNYLSDTDVEFETFPGTRLSKRKVHLHLLSILGAFQNVPKDIAPNNDKGIYFEKAINDLKTLIQKYNGDGLRCPDCGAKVEWDGEYFNCSGCNVAWDTKEYEQALYTLRGKTDYSQLVIEEDPL